MDRCECLSGAAVERFVDRVARIIPVSRMPCVRLSVLSVQLQGLNCRGLDLSV